MVVDLDAAESSGVTPLETLMTRLNLANHDLVAVSTEQLTHKMVAKGCKGKELTPNIQHKIWSALKTLKPEVTVTLKELFP